MHGMLQASVVNKRRHERIKTSLLGRYMLADGREAKCTVVDVSLSGAALAAPERGEIGEIVVLYVDQIGRLEGRIVRHLDGGFALALDVSTRVTQRLAERLREVASGGKLRPSPERREEARMKLDPEQSPRVAGDSKLYQVLDLSITGADVKLSGERPLVGAIITVGKLRGRVVRHTPGGVAIVFIDPPATLTRRLKDIK
jgi:hypothetical protein